MFRSRVCYHQTGCTVINKKVKMHYVIHRVFIYKNKDIGIFYYLSWMQNVVVVLLLLLFTANGFVLGGSGTTIHSTQNHKHSKVHVLHTLKTENGIKRHKTGNVRIT